MKPKAPFKYFGVVLIAGAVFVLTTPSEHRHRTVIGGAIGEESPVAGALGLNRLAARVGFTYHDYRLFSTTTLKGSRSGTLKSIGILGMVFVLDD